MESAADGKLLGPDGRPRFGLRPRPLEDLSMEGFRLHGAQGPSRAKNEFIKDFKLKRWQFLGVCGPDFTLGAAVVDVGYLSNAFIYVHERESGRITEFNANQALGAHTSFPEAPGRGRAAFSAGQASIEMENSPDSTVLSADVPAGIHARLRMGRSLSPLSLVTRVGLSGFSYTDKESCLPVEGSLSVCGNEYAIRAGDAFGLMDFTFGVLGRYTFWNWAAGAGRGPGGQVLGFNLVQGVNETGHTENALWLDGRMEKVDVVDFSYDDRDRGKPWLIRSSDGKVDLAFRPEGERAADINMGVISSHFRQPFGAFSGTLRFGTQALEIEGVRGFVEEHESLW